jgi:hypothetical protein
MHVVNFDTTLKESKRKSTITHTYTRFDVLEQYVLFTHVRSKSLVVTVDISTAPGTFPVVLFGTTTTDVSPAYDSFIIALRVASTSNCNIFFPEIIDG